MGKEKDFAIVGQFGKNVSAIVGYAARERRPDLGSAIQHYAREMPHVSDVVDNPHEFMVLSSTAMQSLAAIAPYRNGEHESAPAQNAIANAFGEWKHVHAELVEHGADENRDPYQRMRASVEQVLIALRGMTAKGGAPARAGGSSFPDAGARRGNEILAYFQNQDVPSGDGFPDPGYGYTMIPL